MPYAADEPFDFRDLLSKPIGEWEELPLLPVCHVFGECVEVLEGASQNKGTKRFAFICSPREFGPDADEKTKEEFRNVDLSQYEFPNRQYLDGNPAGVIYITPRAMNMNREFFNKMGFEDSTPMDRCLQEMVGRKVLMGIGREKNEKSGREFNVMVTLTQDPR